MAQSDFEDPRSQFLVAGMTPLGDGRFINPSTGEIFDVGESPAVPGQFAWYDGGIQPLGGSTLNVVSPFMQILEQFQGGVPIDATNWIDAAKNSLTGFMRSVAPGTTTRRAVDPATIYDPEVAGLPGSQFRFGTLQDLVQDPTIAGLFFDTVGAGGLREVTNQHGNLVGWEQLDPNGNVIGRTLNQDIFNVSGSPSTQITQAGFSMNDPVSAGRPGTVTGGQFDPLFGLDPLTKLLVFEDVPVGSPLEQILGPIPSVWGPSDEDFNDYIFKLNIGEYRPPPELIKASPESVLNKFFDTPAYRLAFGNGDEVTDGSLGPQERFQFDPGYQFAQEEGQRQLMQGHAAQGLLESGASLRDVLRYSQGLADQNYQRWLGQNMGMFSDYQNQLRGLASQGLALTNPALTQQVGGNLGNLQAQLGSNLGNLFGNQGVFGGSAFLNTGAAQANTVMQAASLQAQVQAANQAAQNAGAQGLLGGVGQLLGAFF